MADTAGEPRRIIPALGPFYDNTRDISWLIVRLTAGGFLLIHGLQKLFNATFTVWAANVLSKRGIEPAIPLAYCVWFIETVGAVCIMLGLYTRLFVAMAGVQMLVIIFFAHWGGGFAGFPWNRPTGGWEYPAFWGLHPARDRIARRRALFARPQARPRALTRWRSRGGRPPRQAGLIQTLLSWNAAPPNGAIGSAPVMVLMPRPSG